MNFGRMLQLGGMVAGGMTGTGPAGIAAGGSIGGMIGGALEPEQKAQQMAQVKAKTVVPVGPTSAMQRRIGAIEKTPLSQVTAGLDSLKYVQDDQLRADLAKPLLQADYLARNTREA